MSTRRAWIGSDAALAVSRQCTLKGVARSWVYGAAAGEARDALDGLLLGLIDAPYTRRPFYGSRRRVVFLRTQGHAVNRKRCLLYTSPSPRDGLLSRMPSSA